MQWIGFIVKGLFYALCIAILAPALILFRIDERSPIVDDGLHPGYDDDDPGKDVDE